MTQVRNHTDVAAPVCDGHPNEVAVDVPAGDPRRTADQVRAFVEEQADAYLQAHTDTDPHPDAFDAMVELAVAELYGPHADGVRLTRVQLLNRLVQAEQSR